MCSILVNLQIFLNESMEYSGIEFFNKKTAKTQMGISQVQ